jgi:hypothetical protein
MSPGDPLLLRHPGTVRDSARLSLIGRASAEEERPRAAVTLCFFGIEVSTESGRVGPRLAEHLLRRQMPWCEVSATPVRGSGMFGSAA